MKNGVQLQILSAKDNLENRTDSGIVDSFLVNDVCDLLELLHEEDRWIYYIAAHEGSHDGQKRAILDVAMNAQPKYVVLIDSYVSSNDYKPEDYPDGLPDEIMEKELQWQREMLEEIGFKSINFYVGYESKEAFVYTKNHIGELVYEKAMEIHTKGSAVE